MTTPTAAARRLLAGPRSYRDGTHSEQADVQTVAEAVLGERTMADDKRCDNCRWWYSLMHSQGHCRRYPPVVVAIVQGEQALPYVSTEWPTTSGYMVCGEWQPKEDGDAPRT